MTIGRRAVGSDTFLPEVWRYRWRLELDKASSFFGCQYILRLSADEPDRGFFWNDTNVLAGTAHDNTLAPCTIRQCHDVDIWQVSACKIWWS